MAKTLTVREDQKQMARQWLEDYFGLERRDCSLWEWFQLKTSGNRKLAEALWQAVDADAELRRRHGRDA